MHKLWVAAAMVVGVLVCTMGPLVEPVAGQQRRERPAAITDPAAAGSDFALQGEYAGWLFVPGRGYEYTGLQVVALGGGQFDAVQYRGGLPGNGWDRATKAALSGTADEERLVLTGPSGQIAIAGNIAVATDGYGNELGRLAKVERYSPTLGAPAPAGALVLFDGSSTEHFQNGRITPEGHLAVGATTDFPVGAFQLHLEFRTPFMPTARGQARANSGVYIQRRYEVQILDSFGLEGIENECGALYRQQRPDVNLCLPPLVWQTYDIWFTPPVFAADGTTKLANARISVLHNGYPIHWNREVVAKTGGGQPEAPHPLPIQLQDHGNPVVFKNIWIVLPPEPSAAPQQQVTVYAPYSARDRVVFGARRSATSRRWHRRCFP